MSDAFNPRLPTLQIPVLLKGQKALVTGASSGIGRAVAIALGAAGADVAVNYLDGEEGRPGSGEHHRRRRLARHRHQGGRLGRSRGAGHVPAMYEEFGTLDILVNNAGVQRDAPFDRMTLAQWNQVIGVNLTGQFLCAREALREFKRRGRRGGKSRWAAGKIICISSVHEVIPWSRHANYAASKGGTMMMMKSLAQEAAPLRVRVNGICPGAIRTPINAAAWNTPEAYASLLDAYSLPTNRRARRHRPGRRDAGLRPVGLHHGREHLRRRRNDAVPGILHRRLAAPPGPQLRAAPSSGNRVLPRELARARGAFEFTPLLRRARRRSVGLGRLGLFGGRRGFHQRRQGQVWPRTLMELNLSKLPSGLVAKPNPCEKANPCWGRTAWPLYHLRFCPWMRIVWSSTTCQS